MKGNEEAFWISTPSSLYSYIAGNLSAPIAADNMIDALESAIYSLETFPERGAIAEPEYMRTAVIGNCL